MKTVYLHVGAGKTGTSALQVFFKQNEKVFASKGFVFPTPGRAGRKDAIAHHKLSDHGAHKSGTALDFWKEISESSAPNLVISSESFHSRISERDGLEFFSEVKALLSGWRVVVIFYIRRQSQWLQSAYSQWTKSNINVRSIDELVSVYRKNLADQVFLFSDVFGAENIVVRPFEKEQFYERSIFKDFLHVLGLSKLDCMVYPSKNENSRMLKDALEAKRMLNQFAKNADDVRIFEQLLMDYSIQQAKDEVASEFYTHSLLTAEMTQDIEDKNEKKYAEIAKVFMKRRDGVLFKDDVLPVSIKDRDRKADLTKPFAYLIYRLGRLLEEDVRRTRT